MLFKGFSIAALLLLDFIGTTLASMYCYKAGYNFKNIGGDDEDLSSAFIDFCNIYRDQEIHNDRTVRNITSSIRPWNQGENS